MRLYSHSHLHMWHYAPPAQALELEPEWPGQRLRVAMWQVVLAKKVYKEAMAERFETWIPVGVTWCTKYHEFQWQSTSINYISIAVAHVAPRTPDSRALLDAEFSVLPFCLSSCHAIMLS